MIVFLHFLILLFLPSISTTAGLFDLAEYRRVSYDASIGENFLWFAPDLDIREVTASNIDDFEKRIVNKIPDESLPNYVFVTSKGGQKFACSLPDVEELKKPNSPKSSKNPKIYSDALAASFYVDKCIKLRGNHWWSYILCRGQTVEQVHGEPGQEGYAKNILGIFDGSLKMPSYYESTEDRLLYVEESYTSGTFCDLEDHREPRMTTVRYECDSQLSTNEAYVSSVVEVRPCQYLMTVKVGTLCHYPEFLPASQANTKNIGCQPYLTKNDVREMLERQVDEKRKKAEMQKNMALIRQRFHRAIERYNAMTKSQRNLHIPDVMKKMNAEMDYHAAHFDLLVASIELEGETVTDKKRDYMWKLFSTADIGDYMFYADYDSIKDENRAHLWYYFHDPSWPKNQFPKDILSIAIQNGYIEEVQTKLKGQYVFGDDGGFVEGLVQFLRTGEVDLETNLVIPAMDIYDEIIDIGLFVEKNYNWLYGLYMFFGDERDETDTIEGIIKKIMKPAKYKNFFPMGNLARGTISIVLEEVWEDMLVLSKNGVDSEIRQYFSPDFKSVYGTLEIKKAPQNNIKMKERKFKYSVSASKEDLVEMEMAYVQLLAPLYQLLSIRWFQRQNPNYYHVRPPSFDWQKHTNSDDFKFHNNLSRDLGYFARLLAYTTLLGIKDFESWRDKGTDSEVTAESIMDFWMNEAPPVSEDALEYANIALYDDYGPSSVTTARKQIWEKKVERYRTSYWVKDYKLRKQAQSMQGLMKDLLSVKDDSDAFVSYGGTGGLKKDKDIFDEKWLKKLSLLDSVDELNVESLKERLTSNDDDFFEWDDMKDVLDLLEKAGLSKKAEVQIKMFDADGNEIKSDELEEVAKRILDVADSSNRFKETEKAYSNKLFKNVNEEEEK